MSTGGRAVPVSEVPFQVEIPSPLQTGVPTRESWSRFWHSGHQSTPADATDATARLTAAERWRPYGGLAPIARSPASAVPGVARVSPMGTQRDISVASTDPGTTPDRTEGTYRDAYADTGQGLF